MEEMTQIINKGELCETNDIFIFKVLNKAKKQYNKETTHPKDSLYHRRGDNIRSSFTWFIIHHTVAWW